MRPTIREIVRYFREHPEVEAQFKRNSGGRGPRAYVQWHSTNLAPTKGWAVWREPQPARLWHLIWEARMPDDWHLLARMSPEYRVPPEAPTEPPAPPAKKPPKTTPPSQQAARILAANPYIHVAWGRLTQDEQRTWGSLIEFALANPDIKP